MLKGTPELDIQIPPRAYTQGVPGCARQGGTSPGEVGMPANTESTQKESVIPETPAAALAEIREGIILEAAKAQAKRARVSLLLEYLLFMLIPIAGIVIAATWAFSDRGDTLRRNLARAMLIAMVVMLVLYLLIALVLAPYFTAWLYDEWQENIFWQEDERWELPPENSRPPEGTALSQGAVAVVIFYA